MDLDEAELSSGHHRHCSRAPGMQPAGSQYVIHRCQAAGCPASLCPTPPRAYGNSSLPKTLRLLSKRNHIACGKRTQRGVPWQDGCRSAPAYTRAKRNCSSLNVLLWVVSSSSIPERVLKAVVSTKQDKPRHRRWKGKECSPPSHDQGCTQSAIYTGKEPILKNLSSSASR